MRNRLRRRVGRERRPGYVFGPSEAGADVGITARRPREASASGGPPRDAPPAPTGLDALLAVRAGMPVSDAAGAVIGRVRSVHPGGSADAGEGGARIPADARDRLLERGFVLIDSAGVLAADRFALADEIASVADGEVRLRVWRDQLIRADGPA
jgi:hypothetical protein